MFDTQFAAGLVLLALLTILPGADMALVAKVALVDGRPAALRTTLGICAGLPLHAAASALGLAVVLATSATAFSIVKIAGAAYLAYLGVQTIRHAGAPAAIAPARPSALRTPFLQGFLSNLLNPKVALFYLTFLPQFIGPGDDVFLRSEAFALSHAAMGLAWLTLYAWAIDRIGALLVRSGARRWLERTTGGLLVALGARLALEPR